MSAKAKLILIRHGQTDRNLKKRYCGFTDVCLNEKGKRQARQLFKRLNKEKIHRVYSSDTRRAFQFARIVFKNMPIEKLTSLREMNFGVFENLTYKEVLNKYRKIYEKWLKDPSNIAIPKGESLANLATRVRNALTRILSSNNNRTVAIVTHAGPIRVILCDILKLDLKDIWQIEPTLASVSTIEFIKGDTKLHLLNDTSYLNG